MPKVRRDFDPIRLRLDSVGSLLDQLTVAEGNVQRIHPSLSTLRKPADMSRPARNSDTENVTVDCTFVKETANAVLIEVHDEEVWIPLSQVKSMHKGPRSSIRLSAWIAQKKGLIEE